MAIIKRTANGETLTRTLAANIIAGLADKDQLVGVDGSVVLNGADGRDSVDGGLGHDTRIGGAGTDCRNDGEVEGRPDNNVVPLFNIFRPF